MWITKASLCVHARLQKEEARMSYTFHPELVTWLPRSDIKYDILNHLVDKKKGKKINYKPAVDVPHK